MPLSDLCSLPQSVPINSQAERCSHPPNQVSERTSYRTDKCCIGTLNASAGLI